MDFRERIRNLVLAYKNIQIVGEANNGMEALQLALEKEPDLIILDIRMPLMNGIEVLKKLKAHGSKTIVCILTSYSYAQYKSKCLALGSDYYFSKSDDFEMINPTIEKIQCNDLAANLY